MSEELGPFSEIKITYGEVRAFRSEDANDETVLAHFAPRGRWETPDRRHWTDVEILPCE